MNRAPGKLIALAAACLFLEGCAQMGPPLPPSLELPKAPNDLRVTRKGDRVTLAWTQPSLTTRHLTVRYLGPTRVCRSAASELTDCGTPVASVAPLPLSMARSESNPNTQDSQAAKPPQQIYVDAIPATALTLSPPAGLRYAVEVMNRDGRSAGLSNQVRVPAVATLPPPADFHALLTADAVVLSWNSPGNPSAPATQSPSLRHFYRIYRRDESTGNDRIAGEVPIGEAGVQQFADTAFTWERTYRYRITTVTVEQRRPEHCPRDPSADASGLRECLSEAAIEGDDSAPVSVVAHDIFPPATPAGLQAVSSGEGQKPFVDLIWIPVPNADVAGYNIYRSEASAVTMRVNSDLVKSTAYRDGAVRSGKTYTYWVSAVDARGNESTKSEPATESVP